LKRPEILVVKIRHQIECYDGLQVFWREIGKEGLVPGRLDAFNELPKPWPLFESIGYILPEIRGPEMGALDTFVEKWSHYAIELV
jgi:hypothetical protein